jgi:hypothetical protein
MKQAVNIVVAISLLGCAAQAHPTPGGSYSNNSNSFNNNTCTAFGNGNTIACGPVVTHPIYNESIAESLTMAMPDKTKPVHLITVGGQADQEVGAKYLSFLVKKGYKVQLDQTATYFPRPDQPLTRPITLQINGNRYQYEIITSPVSPQ